jgi:hypothetical protein
VQRPGGGGSRPVPRPGERPGRPAAARPDRVARAGAGPPGGSPRPAPYNARLLLGLPTWASISRTASGWSLTCRSDSGSANTWWAGSAAKRAQTAIVVAPLLGCRSSRPSAASRCAHANPSATTISESSRWDRSAQASGGCRYTAGSAARCAVRSSQAAPSIGPPARARSSNRPLCWWNAGSSASNRRSRPTAPRRPARSAIATGPCAGSPSTCSYRRTVRWSTRVAPVSQREICAGLAGPSPDRSASAKRFAVARRSSAPSSRLIRSSQPTRSSKPPRRPAPIAPGGPSREGRPRYPSGLAGGPAFIAAS